MNTILVFASHSLAIGMSVLYLFEHSHRAKDLKYLSCLIIADLKGEQKPVYKLTDRHIKFTSRLLEAVIRRGKVANV